MNLEQLTQKAKELFKNEQCNWFNWTAKQREEHANKQEAIREAIRAEYPEACKSYNCGNFSAHACRKCPRFEGLQAWRAAANAALIPIRELITQPEEKAA